MGLYLKKKAKSVTLSHSFVLTESTFCPPYVWVKGYFYLSTCLI